MSTTISIRVDDHQKVIWDAVNNIRQGKVGINHLHVLLEFMEKWYKNGIEWHKAQAELIRLTQSGNVDNPMAITQLSQKVKEYYEKSSELVPSHLQGWDVIIYKIFNKLKITEEDIIAIVVEMIKTHEIRPHTIKQLEEYCRTIEPPKPIKPSEIAKQL